MGTKHNAKYVVTLTSEERKELLELVKKGKAAAYKIKHANILLASDENGENPPAAVAKACHCHAKTVYNLRKQFVEQGFSTEIGRKKYATPWPPSGFPLQEVFRTVLDNCMRHFFMAPSKPFRPLEIRKENWTPTHGGAEDEKKIQVGRRPEKSTCFHLSASLAAGRCFLCCFPHFCASASNSFSLT